MIGRGPPRLIPAHAGKTAANWSATFLAAAHPRSRGENVREDTDRRCGHGLIPAHAGKTGGSGAMGVTRWAHPRSRGENDDRHFKVERRHGSSPLTRGKRPQFGLFRPVSRLIPAHAGKTMSAPADCLDQQAHPRSRGENSPCGMCRLRRLGSSPLTRGKRFADAYDRLGNGLIPAHAGKTRCRRRRCRRRSAHPRSRGENPAIV